jgi:threonine dehydratase
MAIYVPETINSRKLAKIERLAKTCGATIELHGEDCVEAERLARRTAEVSGAVYISPYNDIDVISGQGTIAMEILMEKSPEELDAIFVPVGGGGLIAGIAQVVKKIAPHVRIIGCQPEVSDVMRQSVDEGSIVTIPWIQTLAEGVSGGIEEDSITLGPCMDLVDEWVTVSEEQIAHAMVGMHGHHGQQVEGAAAVTVASIMKKGQELMGKQVVAIVCGGNVAGADLDAAYDIVRGLSPNQNVKEAEGKASAF